MSTVPVPAPDFATIKIKQQAAWATGNFAVIGSSMILVPELLVESMDIRSGWTVLDVAAGNGNASLAAARRWCKVTSTDFVPALLELGSARAAADGFAIDFQLADAEDLPFAANSFDAVLSTFGAMFAPDQPRTASELFRVCKPGGKIGLANWTPTSFVGQMFKTLGKYIPPAAGLHPPSLWGTADRLEELFHEASNIATRKLFCDFRFLSPEHWLDIFRTYYGPVNKAYGALDGPGQAALTADLIALLHSLNRATDGTLVLPSEYLEVVITK